MKKFNLAILQLVFLTSLAFGQKVTIGTQVWSKKNLDVATFRNGDAIPQVKTPEEWVAAIEKKQPAWGYYDGDPANGAKYGRLYNWYAVSDPRGLAPKGWHVPTDDEWTTLADFLGGKEVAGIKMKSKAWIGNVNGTDASGFSALAGGYFSSARFSNLGNYTSWWSTTEGETVSGACVYYRYLTTRDDKLSKFFDPGMKTGMYVRCIKD